MKKKTNIILVILFSIFNSAIFAQDATQAIAAAPVNTNGTLRYTLLGTAIVLMIVVIALATILKNLSTFYFENWKKENNDSSRINVTTIITILVGLSAITANAQEVAVVTVAPVEAGFDWANLPIDIYLLGFGVLAELIIIYGLVTSIFKLLKKADSLVAEADRKPEKSFFESINETVALEDEHTLDLNHDYDGIRELDNKVPGWWRMAFYASIIFAPIYLYKFYGDKSIKSQFVELAEANAIAATEKEAYLKTSANSVDENTVAMSDEAGISAGKELYMANCVACHGDGGQGGVGPNLTDDYWMHKGGLKGIFYSIKYGWAEKGMKSWKDDFSASQMAQLSSYIVTLKGTNPPNPKEKQGELFTEDGAVASTDSTTVASADSTSK